MYRDPDAPTHEIYGDSQWQVLRKLVDSRHPRNIAVDISETHAFSDGLTVGMHDKLIEALGAENAKKVIHAEDLALEYQELRVPEMLPSYREMMKVVHTLISRVFSNEVITPGKTTDEDVVWWLRQQVNDMGYGTWFQPSVMVQRMGAREGLDFLHKEHGVTIERGDVLHTDFGITAMRLNTDTQHMGYVLRTGETDVPAGLKRALANGNRLQDIVLERLRPGHTGKRHFGRLTAGYEGGAFERNDLQPSHRRLWERRRAADRVVGQAGGSAGTRRCEGASGVLVLDQAVGMDAGS
ncbi:MAG: hypothetical protein M3Y24_00780 [Acidobacteriota bacterium]|nr:hypothetical protein [Acidobacteriota bacterium]